MAVPVGLLPGEVLVLGAGGLVRHPLGAREINIGRDPDNDLRVPDRTVARRHARLIARMEGGYWIEDLRSHAGIFVNHERVTFEALVVGDVVQLAGLRLRFEHTAPPAGRAVVPRDEEARLVLADALCDRGDPQGELIQYQTGLDRLPDGDPRRAELATLAQVLLDRHERSWVAPLPLPVEDWRFRHGGLAAVRLDAHRLLDDPSGVAALLAAHPIRCVAFTPGTLDEALLARVVRAGLPEGITQVELPRGLTDATLERRLGGTDGVYGPEPPYWDRYYMS